jgi:hypothetical protein
LSAARWAAAEIADPSPQVLQFIAITEAEETRLRNLFDDRRITAHNLMERIQLARATRGLSSSSSGDMLTAIEVTSESEAAIDWLVEALCAFATGNLHAQFVRSEDRVDILLDADWFPEELLPPFRLERLDGRVRVAGSLPAWKA